MTSWVPFAEARAEAQRTFYATQGTASFGVGAVPWRLSTGRAMARLVRDAAIAFAHSQGKPFVKVVDLGAGNGRLGFHVAAPGIRVALCEQSKAMVDAWAANRQLAHMEHHLVDATDERSLRAALQVEANEALVVVGTYLFDSLPHELVRVESGTVRRGGLTANGPEFRDDAALDARCAHLQHEGTYFAPVGALRCVDAVERAAMGPALFLFADKGPMTWAEALEHDELRVASHGGAWSVMVNFPLLHDWLAPRSWHSHAENTSDFAVCAVALNAETPANIFPAEHPLRVQRTVTQTRSTTTLAELLSLTPDPDTLLELADELRALACPELLGWVERAVDALFLVAGDDVLFHAATIAQRAAQFDRARTWYTASLAHAGRHPTTLFNRALCHLEFGDIESASQDLVTVLELEPAHSRADPLLRALREALTPRV